MAEKFRRLQCMVEAPLERCWHRLFHAEAASLRFTPGYEDVPKEKRPIVLGRIRFLKSGGMTLETHSIQRAIEGARFFAADEGTPAKLMTTLDQDVTVIDARETELALQRDLDGVRSIHDAQRALAESLERRIKSKEDVPQVEDFPLAPEEETPEFQDLATGLQFRFVRAAEHWRGNTNLTLTAVIMRAVEEGWRPRDHQGK